MTTVIIFMEKDKCVVSPEKAVDLKILNLIMSLKKFSTRACGGCVHAWSNDQSCGSYDPVMIQLYI